MNVVVVGIAAYLVLHTLTPGRALFAIKGVRLAASPEELAELGQHLDAAAEQARRVRKLNTLWRAGRKLKLGRVGVMALDARVDGLLGGTCESLKRLVKNLPEGHAFRVAAEKLLDEHFPSGAAALTRLPFEEELDEAEALLETLQHPDNQDTVRDLGLGIWRDQLAEVLPDYEAAIRQRAGNPLAYSEVRTARAALQDQMGALLLSILALSLRQPDARRLTTPIDEQHEKISAAYRDRVRPKEVDADSGHDIEDTTALEGEGTAEA